MSEFPLQPLLESLIEFFEKRRVDYMVMGGIAVRFWGIPRPTYDLDFTLAVEEDAIPQLCQRLREEGFSVLTAHEEGFVDRLEGMRKFGVMHYAEGKEVAVDLFLVTTQYQQAAFGRRVQAKISTRSAWLISPEDLILHKLIAGRDRDLSDITDILWMSPEVDTVYLREWAASLGVSDQLERRLAEEVP